MWIKEVSLELSVGICLRKGKGLSEFFFAWLQEPESYKTLVNFDVHLIFYGIVPYKIADIEL